MFAAKPPWLKMPRFGRSGPPPIKNHREDIQHETSSIPQNRGCRPGRVGGRRAGHRAIDAGAEMALDGQLAEIARHAVRRRRGFCRGRRRRRPTTSSKSRPLPPAKSCRRCRRSTPPRTAPSRSAHTASYYYFGKDPTFGFGTSIAFGPNQRLNQGWYYEGGGNEVLNEFYKKYNVTMLARRQHRLPDGRLVPQGDQHRRRSQGSQIPHRRLPRQA